MRQGGSAARAGLAAVYTPAGDRVPEAEATRGGGRTFFWDMITRNGQNVASGMYLYSVQTGGGLCRGRFVIIR
jgi:hypothetical protein